MTQSQLVGHWTDIVNVASERFSDIVEWGGCLDAAHLVRDRFESYGIATELQSYRSDYAPNVVATLAGATHPGAGLHRRRPPRRPAVRAAAPGADDNASGRVAVLQSARVLSRSASRTP